MKIEITPKYVIIKQQEYCCVPTCIQMIFSRRNIPLIYQEDIGWELGLIVPEKDKHLFNRIRTRSNGSPDKNYLPGFFTNVNKFFQKYDLQLHMDAYSIEKVKDVKEFICKQISEGNDTIACFNSKKLNGKNDGEHVALISAIDEDKVELADPAGWFRTVQLTNLINSMEYSGKEKGGGFWVVK